MKTIKRKLILRTHFMSDLYKSCLRNRRMHLLKCDLIVYVRPSNITLKRMEKQIANS